MGANQSPHRNATFWIPSLRVLDDATCSAACEMSVAVT